MSAADAFNSDGGFWRQVFDQASAPMAILDLQGRYVYVNRALCELLGYSSDQLYGRDYREVTHPEDADPAGPAAASTPLEKRYIRADGTVIWGLVSRSFIQDEFGRATHFLSQIQDITERRELELLWERSFANAPIGMAILDLQGNWIAVNDELCSILGYARDELLAMSFVDLTYELDEHRGRNELDDMVAGRRDSATMEKRYRHQDGRPIWMFIRATAVPHADGSPAFIVSQYESIGDRRLVDAHLAHLALHDPLTGLANRVLLEDRMEQELNQLFDGSGVLALLVADLDLLKPINDQYGHAQGDQLLMAAARQLQQAVRVGDTVARIGGDEFVVMSLLPGESSARAFRDRVAEHLDTEVMMFGVRMDMRASVGMATTSDPEISAAELLHRADRDMFERKSSRRSPDR